MTVLRSIETSRNTNPPRVGHDYAEQVACSFLKLFNDVVPHEKYLFVAYLTTLSTVRNTASSEQSDRSLIRSGIRKILWDG